METHLLKKKELVLFVFESKRPNPLFILKLIMDPL